MARFKLSPAQQRALGEVKGPEAELVRALAFVAQHLSSDEGSRKDTEDDFGLDYAEVVEMAHDNMIGRARHALREYGSHLAKKRPAGRAALAKDGEGRG